VIFTDQLLLTVRDNLPEVFTCERHRLNCVVVVVVEVDSFVRHVQRCRNCVQTSQCTTTYAMKLYTAVLLTSAT